MKQVFAKISLKPTADGGRETSITGGQERYFSCPLFFLNVPRLAHHGYDCRIYLNKATPAISPGDTVERISVAFLDPETVLHVLDTGAQFVMWEGKVIGSGEVIDIIDIP